MAAAAAMGGAAAAAAMMRRSNASQDPPSYARSESPYSLNRHYRPSSRPVSPTNSQLFRAKRSSGMKLLEPRGCGILLSVILMAEVGLLLYVLRADQRMSELAKKEMEQPTCPFCFPDPADGFTSKQKQSLDRLCDARNKPIEPTVKGVTRHIYEDVMEFDAKKRRRTQLTMAWAAVGYTLLLVCMSEWFNRDGGFFMHSNLRKYRAVRAMLWLSSVVIGFTLGQTLFFTRLTLDPHVLQLVGQLCATIIIEVSLKLQKKKYLEFVERAQDKSGRELNEEELRTAFQHAEFSRMLRTAGHKEEPFPQRSALLLKATNVLQFVQLTQWVHVLEGQRTRALAFDPAAVESLDRLLTGMRNQLEGLSLRDDEKRRFKQLAQQLSAHEQSSHPPLPPAPFVVVPPSSSRSNAQTPPPAYVERDPLLKDEDSQQRSQERREDERRTEEDDE
ncbi:hypothetical protein M3Y99_00678600 [Aphelenchoides fujianensis]|nr:hypothetical protein M3Y99_00678600 [Aphelenchoides fujianensis]